MKTLTRDDVAALSFTGDDWFAPNAQPHGFVRIAGEGYVSSHVAYERVIAGKLDVAQNIRDIDAEDFARTQPVRDIEAAAAKRERDERQHRIDAAAHERERNARIAAERAAAIEVGASTVRRLA